jgi:hypothetical protein
VTFLATVTQESPLKVRIDGATTSVSASVLTRADTYAPALNARVLVLQRGSRLIVLGGLS